MNNIIEQLKNAELTGRGGGCFPTWKKWEMVKEAEGEKRFVVCNISEGEPGVKKDKYILDYYMDEALDGIKIAIDFIKADRAYLYLNHHYYDECHKRLRHLIGDYPIFVFKKDDKAGYIGGEETAVLNHLEGDKVEPRLRPPFPTTHGLWGFPTIVNNLETFRNVHLVVNDRYESKRLFTVGGDIIHRGVFEYDQELTIAEVLKYSGNYPDYPFFVQVGGDASGSVFDSDQLDVQVVGSASITVYSKEKHKPLELIRNWANFFARESCGQCTPCREGTGRLKEELDRDDIDWELCGELVNTLSETSFCGLGLVAPVAIKTYVDNVLSKQSNEKITFPNATNDYVCSCFRG